jgi:hypothetical protein
MSRPLLVRSKKPCYLSDSAANYTGQKLLAIKKMGFGLVVAGRRQRFGHLLDEKQGIVTGHKTTRYQKDGFWSSRRWAEAAVWTFIGRKTRNCHGTQNYSLRTWINKCPSHCCFGKEK